MANETEPLIKSANSKGRLEKVVASSRAYFWGTFALCLILVAFAGATFRGSNKLGDQQPRVLLAVISWRGGLKDLQLFQNSWKILVDECMATGSCGGVAFEYKVIVGRKPENAPEQQDDEVDALPYVVSVDAEDTYESLPAKVLAAMEYARLNGYDWVAKVDDDVFLNPAVLGTHFKRWTTLGVEWSGFINGLRYDQEQQRVSARCDKEWHFGKASREDINKTPYSGVLPVAVDGGHGYFVHKNALEKLSRTVRAKNEWLKENEFVNIYEDLLISALLQLSGVKLTDWSGWQATYDIPNQAMLPSSTLLNTYAGQNAFQKLFQCRSARFKGYSENTGNPEESLWDAGNLHASCLKFLGICTINKLHDPLQTAQRMKNEAEVLQHTPVASVQPFHEDNNDVLRKHAIEEHCIDFHIHL